MTLRVPLSALVPLSLLLAGCCLLLDLSRLLLPPDGAVALSGEVEPVDPRSRWIEASFAAARRDSIAFAGSGKGATMPNEADGDVGMVPVALYDVDRDDTDRRPLSDTESADAPKRKRRNTDLQGRPPEGLSAPTDASVKGQSFHTTSRELVAGTMVSSYVLVKKLRDLGVDDVAGATAHIEYVVNKDSPNSPPLGYSAPLWPAQYGAIPMHFGGLLAPSSPSDDAFEFDIGEYADDIREEMHGIPATPGEQNAVDIVACRPGEGKSEDGGDCLPALEATLATSPTTVTVRRQSGPVVPQKRKYRLREKFAKGAYGEVWRAVRPGDGGHYILKRMFVEKGNDVRMSGMREIHYGRKLHGLAHIARFVEYFEGGGSDAGTELWLVFHDEGIALHGFLYSRIDDGAFARVERSAFWHRLKTDPNGPNVMKAIMRQLLSGIAVCHEHNVTHRDIKPENLILSYVNERPEVMLADFGSAVEKDFHGHLYPPEGPTKDEATLDYAPPEVTFSVLPFDGERPESYDIWSAGIVFMEMILGTPKVFTIDERARARIDLHLHDKSDDVKEAAYKFKAMQQYCLYPPNGETTVEEESLSDMLGTSVMKAKCTKDTFYEILKKNDPLGLGLEDPMGVDLLKRLLSFNAADRIRARESLTHAYFTRDDGEPYKCPSCGREFALGTHFAKHLATEHGHR